MRTFKGLLLSRDFGFEEELEGENISFKDANLEYKRLWSPPSCLHQEIRKTLVQWFSIQKMQIIKLHTNRSSCYAFTQYEGKLSPFYIVLTISICEIMSISSTYLHHLKWAKAKRIPKWASSKETANPFDTKTGSGTNLKLTDLKAKDKLYKQMISRARHTNSNL